VALHHARTGQSRDVGFAAAGSRDVGFAAAWRQALDELELEVDRAEAMLRAEHDWQDLAASGTTSWVAPRIPAPLPESMRERAERILERQLAVAGRLSTAMTSSRRHLDVVDRLVPSDARPMYVDQTF
jgi:hypothetical protein